MNKEQRKTGKNKVYTCRQSLFVEITGQRYNLSIRLKKNYHKLNYIEDYYLFNTLTTPQKPEPIPKIPIPSSVRHIRKHLPYLN